MQEISMALREHLTPKQDAFAMAYVETGNASEAYRRAYAPKRMGQKAVTVESTRLLRHPSVSLAIARQQQDARERHDVTVDGLTADLTAARQLAMKLGNPGAAVAATMAIAKLHGLLRDKVEHMGRDGAPSINLTITRSTAPASDTR
jgi:phage terminase small subunit